MSLHNNKSTEGKNVMSSSYMEYDKLKSNYKNRSSKAIQLNHSIIHS